MPGLRSFEEFVAWQLSVQLRDKVYELTKAGAILRDHSLREQLRDAASSPPRNIAEGFGRFSALDFARFVNIAKASLAETQNHLKHARSAGYCSPTGFQEAFRLSCRAMAATARLHKYLISRAAQQAIQRKAKKPSTRTPKRRNTRKNPENP